MAEEPEALAFPLVREGREVVLLGSGVRHPRSYLLGGERFTPYHDLTHVFGGPRWLRLGTRSGLYLIPRGAFQHPEDAVRLVRELVTRISAGPQGGSRIARIAQVEERLRRPPPLRATVGILILCLAVYLLQLALSPRLELIAAFSTTLARIEPWRFLTANLLHSPGIPAHLPLNLLGLLVFGALVERPLGLAATLFVMGASGVGAMAGASLAGLEAVVGASGIVSGLVGAVLWLEFRHCAELPAAWRVPRRLLVTLVIVDNVISFAVPVVAVSGHLGGLVGGLLAAALVTGPALRRERPLWLSFANAVGLVALSASVSAVGFELAGYERALGRRAERLLATEELPPVLLNDVAWLIAVSESPSDSELDVALRLAERAARLSERQDPNILDTLAEVLFQLGRPEDAVETIDEAIVLEPDERYFHEQRRRFTGERAPDDRPDPPGGQPLESDQRFDDPGIRV